MISIRQVKAARALLGWSQEDLAARSGVSYPTIARLESADGEIGGRPETVAKIVSTLEAAGIVFVDGVHLGVGIRAIESFPYPETNDNPEPVKATGGGSGPPRVP